MVTLNGTSSLETIGVDCSPRVVVFEDNDHQNSVLDNLNQLRKSRQFCDVILQVGNREDIHEIYGHKVVLSSASPYLLELFSSDSTAGVQQFKLLSGSYDIEAFDCVIDYAYTARLEVTADKIKDVYAIASRLKMNSIAYQCGQYLLSTLTPENCLTVRSIRGVLNDQFLLASVDGYIRQNMLEVVQSKCLDSLDKIQVEVLLNSDEERAATNEKHVFNMVMEWIRRSFDREELNGKNICEKMFMLYLNKADKCLHDCNEIENGANDDSDLIQDYKRESRRLSFPTKNGSHNQSNSSANGENNSGGSGSTTVEEPQRKLSSGGTPTGGGGGSGGGGYKKSKSQSSVPAKSNKFMFTRSDSESSLSSIADDDNESDWKVVAVCVSGKHSLIGLIVVSGKLFVLTVKLRVNSPMHSPTNTRHNSLEKPELYCLIPTMSCARCAVGTGELNGKLVVCGGYDRGECLRTVEVYDEATNRLEKLNSMLVPRGRFDITVLEGDVYAIGGSDGQNELNSAEMYDHLVQTWRPIPNCPIVRSNAGKRSDK